ncbi:metallopeptidase family protein [Ornithinimicrobium sp. LYQ103]|uniref:metallopeptidase family protein n=1 Tax=Ornithinimicrobium sp. LYQ103 TaxID=3378796 RepID=UPI00385550B7
MSTRRDRRGHGLRGPLAWPRLPVMTSRAARFDDVVLDAAETLEHRLGHELGVELAVEEVPPTDPAPWEHGIPLGRLFPAERTVTARLVLYRRPIEQRAQDEGELSAIVYEVMAEQVARMYGRDPDDLG